jgi:hypothetical protein
MKQTINTILIILIIIVKSINLQNTTGDKKLIYFINFDLFVNDFINFEPKTGQIEMDLSIKYKWWDNSTHNRFLTVDQYNKVRKNIEINTNSFYPVIKFKDNLVKLTVKNQIHRIDNLEELVPPPPPTQKQKSRIKSSKKVYRQYSSLEQHFLIKFNCKSFLNNNPDHDNDDPDKFLNFFNIATNSMDTFPFDTHDCNLLFSLLPRHVNMNNLAQLRIFNLKQPNFSFLINNNMNQNENYLNKLVETSNNYSFIKREWLLKKYTITYSNSNKTKRSNNIEDDETNNKINITFQIFRRREPQIFIFILPLVVFTILTFMIFFISTSASEKTLIAFLNLVCLLGFNVYLFKLMIFVYELVRIPLILQYSNCLMIIQLGVFVYVVLAKSLYFTINNSLLSNLTHATHRQLSYLNSTKTINSLNQFINNSRQDIRIKMPIIKFDGGTYSKGNNSYSSMFMPFNNNVESNVGTARQLLCDCNSIETETDCMAYSKRLNDDRLSIPVDGSWIINKINEKKDKQIYFINGNKSSYSNGQQQQQIKSSSNNEIARLSLNVKKLVKMEELNLKEKLIRNEWSKKAKICDILCFLLAFFLLLICSILIFFVFPSEYFKYTNF